MTTIATLEKLCDYLGIEFESLESQIRIRKCTIIRQMIAAYLFNNCNTSLAKIAKVTHRKSHVTIMNHLSNFERDYKYDLEFRENYNKLLIHMIQFK